MFGGFMGIGTPAKLVQQILDSGVKDHTHSNDTAFIDTGEALIVNNRVKRLIHPILENKSRKLAKNDCW